MCIEKEITENGFVWLHPFYVFDDNDAMLASRRIGIQIVLCRH